MSLLLFFCSRWNLLIFMRHLCNVPSVSRQIRCGTDRPFNCRLKVCSVISGLRSAAIEDCPATAKLCRQIMVRTVTVTAPEALVLRPLLEDRGHITDSIRILVPWDRMKQKCFQITTKRVRRSQQFQLRR